MHRAVSIRPWAQAGLAGILRRATFIALLAAVAFLPRPRPNIFDFPAITHMWVLLVFAALLFVVLVDLQRPWRLANADLLVLLSFLVALAFAGGSRAWPVLLIYPPLAYLATRMFVLARTVRSPGVGSGSLRPLLPRSWLLVGIAVLCAVNVGWAVAAGTPTDVGADSVQGALNIAHGHALYAAPAGTDTYGPANYEAYVPFAAVTSANAAARLATLFFTLLTALLLFALGRQARGPTAGVLLAFCWLAFPFTLYEDALGYNDSLVAATLVGTLVVARFPVRRGLMAAAAAWTKLTPLALVPLLASRRAMGRGGGRDLAAFGAAFVLASGLIFLPVLAHDTPGNFVSRTFGFQTSRVPTVSLWAVLQGGYGLHSAWINTVSRVLHGLFTAAALAVALLLPRARLRQDTVGLAAASAVILLLLQICLSYYSFSYILWFAPLVLVAVILGSAGSWSGVDASDATGGSEPRSKADDDLREHGLGEVLTVDQGLKANRAIARI